MTGCLSNRGKASLDLACEIATYFRRDTLKGFVPVDAEIARETDRDEWRADKFSLKTPLMPCIYANRRDATYRKVASTVNVI